jgi:CDP-4-dehydro-6-deoxyglucose reductase, E3
MQPFNASVAAVRDLTHDVRQIDIALIDPPQIHFVPGQFVSFEIDRPGFPTPVTRPYSIASSPHETDRIELVLNRVPGGPGSTYLFGLREGDPTTFKGPVGGFTLRENQRDVLLVATGTGIAPIRSMLWSLAGRASTRRIALFWGLRSERDLYYQDELTILRQQLPNLSATVTLSQPTGSWRGSTGRVSPLVMDAVTTTSNLEVYLCGNGGMIRDVRDIIRQKGLCPIYTEQYYS